MGLFRPLLCLVSTCLPLLAAAPAKEIRVLTWNIHHGAGMDGKTDLARIAKVISDHQPDVVMLQEVDKNCDRSGKADQAAEIARLTQLKMVFGKAMDLQGGEYGQAILSRTDLADLKVHPLPSQGEPRIAVSATTDTPLGRITVASVHLDYQDEARQNAQAQVCAAALLATPHPVILAGDFNAKPDSRTLANFAQAPWTVIPKAAPALTHPASQPTTEIDYLVLRGLRATREATVTAEATASDHRPVLAIIARPE
jgi:endonuclease/exonuclease/phosphatase family metal-dependent hydrolase